MIAPPPITNLQARVATIEAVQPTANLFDGKLRVGKHCRRVKRSRVCMASITGPVPMRLRVTVWRTADSYYVSARPR